MLLLCEVEAVGEEEGDYAPLLESFALEGIGCVIECVAELFGLFASLESVRASAKQQLCSHVHTEVVEQWLQVDLAAILWA